MAHVVALLSITEAVRVFVLHWRVAHMLLFYTTRITRARLDCVLTVLAIIAVPVRRNGRQVLAVGAIYDLLWHW